jgi:hypothetical protein
MRCGTDSEDRQRLPCRSDQQSSELAPSEAERGDTPMKTRTRHPLAHFVAVFILALALLPSSVAAAPLGHQGPAFLAAEVSANQLSYPVIFVDGVSTGGLP